MKKTVITILLVLPFVLMFIISFMARIVTNYQHVYVDSVCFIDDTNECNNNFIPIGLNEEYELKVKVFPELATNKKVTYNVVDTNIISIDENGKIKGINYGITKVSVKTIDGNKIDEILIKVNDDYVDSIDLSIDSVSLQVGGSSLDLGDYLYINPPTAINKKVSWESSDSSVVKVDSNGVITGLKTGTSTITVTSFDGGYKDVCLVTVIEFDEPFDKVAYEPGKSIYYLNNSEFNLFDLIIIYDDTLLNQDSFSYQIIASSSDNNEDAYIQDKILHIKEGVLVRIKIFAEGQDYSPIINLKLK